MFIAKSPLRLSLGGGGTDLPSYYRKRGGYLIAGAINKYVYTSIIKSFDKGIFLKYSDYEKVDSLSKIKHKLFKEILIMENLKRPYQIELTTLADIPAGTGLGSSGAFLVSAIKAVKTFQNEHKSNTEIAELACKVEIERLNLPVGKQDQYISAIGGLCEFTFNKDDSVEFKRLPISNINLNLIKDSMLLFYTGHKRSSSKILFTQNKKTIDEDSSIIASLDSIKEMAINSRNLLINGDLNQYGLLLQDHWKEKLKRSPDMCPKEIQNYISLGLKNGALGAKLIGAGGGGFIMFICNDKHQLRKKLTQAGLQELSFDFDSLGVQIIDT